MHEEKNQIGNTQTKVELLQTTEKTSSTIIEVTLKAKRYDLTNGHLANEIDYSTKMIKIDSVCCGCGDENFNVTIEPSGEDCPRIFINHYDKSTKAELVKHN